MISNLPYILFGIAFLIFVRTQDVSRAERRAQFASLNNDTEVPDSDRSASLGLLKDYRQYSLVSLFLSSFNTAFFLLLQPRDLFFGQVYDSLAQSTNRHQCLLLPRLDRHL
jgi:hypothetical protein